MRLFRANVPGFVGQNGHCGRVNEMTKTEIKPLTVERLPEEEAVACRYCPAPIPAFDAQYGGPTPVVKVAYRQPATDATTVLFGDSGASFPGTPERILWVDLCKGHAAMLAGEPAVTAALTARGKA